MFAPTRATSAQQIWLTATTRLCRCQRSVQQYQLYRHSSARFSAFAYLSRKANSSRKMEPPPTSPNASPSSSPKPPTSSRPPPSSAEPGSTTVMPDSSSPYMQEDAVLERIALVGYGTDHFEVFNPSSLPQSDDQQSSQSQSTSSPTEEDEAASVPVTASVVSSVAAPSSRSGTLSRGAFSAPNTISMFGSVLALPTAAFLWAPTQWSEVTVESLTVLELLQTKPDLILFGSGNVIQPVDPSVSAYLQQLGIGFEVLQSNNAMATFNLLAEEQRLVMAALLPVGEEAGEQAKSEPEEERPSKALRRRIEERLMQRGG